MGRLEVGHFPPDKILRALAAARQPLTVAEIAEQGDVSASAVRANLAGMTERAGHVHRLEGRPARYVITEAGLESGRRSHVTARRTLSAAEREAQP